MATGTVEQRLSALEQEFAQLKQRFETDNVPPTNPWVDQVWGAFENDPLFEEAVRYGREWRESQNGMDDAGISRV